VLAEPTDDAEGQQQVEEAQHSHQDHCGDEKGHGAFLPTPLDRKVGGREQLGQVVDADEEYGDRQAMATVIAAVEARPRLRSSTGTNARTASVNSSNAERRRALPMADTAKTMHTMPTMQAQPIVG
jgi:hypothetical protein